MANIISKFTNRLKRIIKAGNTKIEFQDFVITIDYSDAGGRLYYSRSAYEETQSSFYQDLSTILNPSIVIDVGANYGFTALIFRKNFPKAQLILVEPSPKLCQYIQLNTEQNHVDKFEIIQALCGSQNSREASFMLNPKSSQDNRVYGESYWQQITVPSITLSKILDTEVNEQSFFIKVDTQGFETQVLQGAYDFLENHRRWLVKTEFAPSWLKSQGNDAKELLTELIEKFSVVEAPARTRFGRDKLCGLFVNPLKLQEVDDFVNYVESLNRSQLGWVDLYIAPKQPTWILEK